MTGFFNASVHKVFFPFILYIAVFALYILVSIGLVPVHAKENDTSPDTLSYLLKAQWAEKHFNIYQAAEFYEKFSKTANNRERKLMQDRIFLSYLRAGNYDAALNLAVRLKNSAGDARHFAGFLLALDAYKNKKWQQVHEIMDNYATDNASRILAVIIKAWTFAAQSNFDEMEKILSPDKASNEATSRLYKVIKSNIYVFHGKPEQAINILLEKTDGPLSLSNLLFIHYIEAFYQLKGSDEALRMLKDNKHNVDKSPTLSRYYDILRKGETLPSSLSNETDRDKIARSLNELASIFAEQLPEASIIYAQFAKFLNPDNTWAMLIMGQILESKELYNIAHDIYVDIPVTSDEYIQAQRHIARILSAKSQQDKALELLHKLNKEYPKDDDIMHQIGYIYRVTDQFDKAVKLYDDWISSLDKVTPANWVIFYYRGISYDNVGEWNLAEKDLLKALELNPNNPSVLNYLGYTWVDRGENLEKGIAMLKTAVEQQPSGEIIDSLGWAYYKLKEYDKAANFIELALERLPEEPVITDHLGDVYWKLGRKREARLQWKRALSFNPDKELKEKINRKIKADTPDI